ncbi:MAG: molybdate ABC transporter substrate-binding protein [Alphaproteobacteria bacterium]|nr:molybdate ABC transporter substrate-binding protein [Alphaproteobacteria bacterium]
MRRRSFLASALASAVAACARPRAADILVLAAISLQDALEAIAVQQPEGPRLSFAFAATSALARQIERGAPGDIFLSADVEWMDYLAERSLIRPETRIDLLSNRLVLIAPAGAPATPDLALTPAAFAAALGEGRLAIADPESVPAGRYGRAALESLALIDVAGQRFARAENVRAALAFVARGEAPLGIVYETDARIEPRVRIVARFPGTAHPRIVYPGAVLTRSTHDGAAAALASLSAEPARGVFEAAGFAVL